MATAALNLSAAQQRQLTGLLRCVGYITDLNPGMPLGEALAFVQVAADPGKGPKEYSQAIGLPETSVSRWLLDLGTPTRGATEKKVLFWRINPENLRMKQYYLNPKGAAVITQCLTALGRA